MLYRFTLTVNIDEDKSTPNNLDKLKNAIKNEAEWIGTNANIKVEDEQCIQTNKKRLVAPIITTLDTNTMPQDKNAYLSAARLITKNLEQLKQVTPDSDYNQALIIAVNCLLEKSGSITEQDE